jgi:hypothetical protein
MYAGVCVSWRFHVPPLELPTTQATYYSIGSASLCSNQKPIDCVINGEQTMLCCFVVLPSIRLILEQF